LNLLQPLSLWALPLVALPVVVHLLHRRRHRVVEWGAMMFLLEGERSSRGRQRLRELLLLAARTLAVLALVLTLGRPIAGGWAARVAGERLDQVILILDRSSSMGERVDGFPETKLAFGLRSAGEALAVTAPRELVVVDATRPAEVLRPEDLDALRGLSFDEATSAGSDVLTAFETAARYVEGAGAGRTEVWVLTDAQREDWAPEDGRWDAVVQQLSQAGGGAGARVRLTTFPEVAEDNLSVRVQSVRRESEGEAAALVLDLVVTRAAATEASGDTALRVPVAIEVGGARTTVEVELTGQEGRLMGHRVAIDTELEAGYGAVEVPTDRRAGDDRYWFAFGSTPVVETAVLAESSTVASVVSVAARSPAGPDVLHEVRELVPTSREEVDLEGAALLAWQVPLPEGDAAASVTRFCEAGGVVLFLPPSSPGRGSFAGVGWGQWVSVDEAARGSVVKTWRADADLLASGADGTPLPVGEVSLRRVCSIRSVGEAPVARIPLAGLEGGQPLMVKSAVGRGAAYFLGTLPEPRSSDLASQGIVFMALVHRALDQASAALGAEEQQVARADGRWLQERWSVAASDRSDSLAERGRRAGVLTDGEVFIALNRPLSEDSSPALPESVLKESLAPLDVVVTTTRAAAEGGSLLDEVWRIFLFLVLGALLAELLLCSPEGSPPRGDAE